MHPVSNRPQHTSHGGQSICFGNRWILIIPALVCSLFLLKSHNRCQHERRRLHFTHPLLATSHLVRIDRTCLDNVSRASDLNGAATVLQDPKSPVDMISSRISVPLLFPSAQFQTTFTLMLEGHRSSYFPRAKTISRFIIAMSLSLYYRQRSSRDVVVCTGAFCEGH